jgi:hypothetical protein
MFQKRSSWVLFAVLLSVGAFLLIYFSAQNPLSVVSNVDAQMPDSFVSDYIRTWQQNPQWSGMNYGSPVIINGATKDTCFSNLACGGGGTWSTCGILGCGGRDTYQVSCSMVIGTSLTCDTDCFDRIRAPRIPSSETFTTCAGLTGCMRIATGSTCPGPTGTICSGGNTMLFCPTSTTCGMSCGGSPTMLFCPTFKSCIGTCPTENPPSFFEGAGPSWGPDGMPMPGGIVPFPTLGSMPLPGTLVPFANYFMSQTPTGAIFD